jgi:hypothetical protein
MGSYTYRLELNEYQVQMLDHLSQKINTDTINLIKKIINEYIEQNLIEEDKRYPFENKQRSKKIMDDEDEEWRLHWNSMNDQQKKQFDDTFKKGLEIGKVDLDFQYTWKGYILTGELPPLETHPDIEWHRLSLLWRSKLTKDTNEDLIFFGRIRELEKRRMKKF